jgi:hypothetical protein
LGPVAGSGTSSPSGIDSSHRGRREYPEEALSFAADQRARIAHELIESLDGDVGAERALQVEAIRAALVEGEQSGIAEDSSLEGILTELRASRAP